MADIVVIAVLLLWMIFELRRDFVQGVSLSLALLVLVPRTVQISSLGAVCELTFDRLLFVTIFICWLQQQGRKTLSAVELLPTLAAFAAASFISLILSIQPGGSAKSLVSYIAEGVGFYIVVSTTFTERGRIYKALFMLASGLFVVAVLATIEKYSSVNPVGLVLTPEDRLDDRGVSATYPHRILLGYAMAIGFVLALGFLGKGQRKVWRLFVWSFVLMTAAACYFAMSRGPWVGAVIGAATLLVLGSGEVRRGAAFAGVLALLVLVIRPGVRETILNLVSSSFVEDSQQGNSYEYRWKLWGVAWKEISKSPERTLFGYGGLSTESMDLQSYFGSQEGGSAAKTGFTSWDNQYAADLIEYGCVGFGIEIVFYICAMIRLLSVWKESAEDEKASIAAILAGCTVYLFAMSNTSIFSPQLKFLFWSLLALGTNLGRVQSAVANKTAASTSVGAILAVREGL